MCLLIIYFYQFVFHIITTLYFVDCPAEWQYYYAAKQIDQNRLVPNSFEHGKLYDLRAEFYYFEETI
jgi:hypothetical protein